MPLCCIPPRVVRRRGRLLAATGCEPEQHYVARASPVLRLAEQECLGLGANSGLHGLPHHRGDAAVSRALRDEWSSSAANVSTRRRKRSHPPDFWLVLARGLHEQGDLDAVVDVELVEEAGDVGLDRGDGEVQRRGDLGVGLAPADG
jgi:hypothetical protein